MKLKTLKDMYSEIISRMKTQVKHLSLLLIAICCLPLNGWGAGELSINLSSISLDVEWGTSTTSISNWITYNSSTGTAKDGVGGTKLQLTTGAALQYQALYADITDISSSGFGITLQDKDGNAFSYYTSTEQIYIGYISTSSSTIDFYPYYTITEPYTTHSANIKFYYYNASSEKVYVLTLPITISMTGGYTISTAIDPVGGGTVTATVDGSARTRVMADEQLDLVATPSSGYTFVGWDGSDNSNILFNDEYASSTYAYITGNQTITAVFEDNCTSRTLTFTDLTVTKNYGTSDAKFQDYTLSNGSGTATWTSSKTSVAEVNSSTGVITIKKAGETTISVLVDADGTYCSVGGSYTLTVNPVNPVVNNTDFSVSSITSSGATFAGGQISSKGNNRIVSYGYVIGTSDNVTWETKSAAAGNNGDYDINTSFTSQTTEALEPNTTYYVRPFAYNGSRFGYGSAVSFTTLQRYTITYNKNDKANTTSTQYKDYGINTTINDGSAFDSIGHTISKRHTLAAGTGGTDYALSETYSDNNNLTLYAVWSPKVCAVTLDKGTSGTEDGLANVTYGATSLTSISHASKDGHSLTGYWTAASGGDKVLNADGSFYTSAPSRISP